MRKILFAALLSVALFGCKKDSPKDDQTPKVTPGIGAYIINEGSYGVGNGSISYYSTSTDAVSNDMYASANGVPLGDVAESMTISNGYGYIVVNASNKMEIVTMADFKHVATIGSLTNPRYFVAINSSKGYLSQWNGNVSIVNLANNTVSGNIAVGAYPERMLFCNSKLYVTNSAGYATDSTISIINTSTDAVTSTITVGGDPKALVKDKNNKIWILCGGNIIYNTQSPYNIISQSPSELVRIDPSTDLIEATIKLSDTLHPGNLGISPDGMTLYYGGGYGFNGIYSMQITATSAPSTTFINAVFYGFSVNNVNGEIYGCVANGTNAGTLNRYTTTGSLIKQYTVGVFPNGAAFNMN